MTSASVSSSFDSGRIILVLFGRRRSELLVVKFMSDRVIFSSDFRVTP